MRHETFLERLHRFLEEKYAAGRKWTTDQLIRYLYKRPYMSFNRFQKIGIRKKTGRFLKMLEKKGYIADKGVFWIVLKTPSLEDLKD